MLIGGEESDRYDLFLANFLNIFKRELLLVDYYLYVDFLQPYFVRL